MLSGTSVVGLPFVDNYIFYITVYLSPLALLVLIVLLNKGYEVFTKPKVLFYVVELLIAGLSVAFILVSDPYRIYILLVTIILSTLAIVI